MGYGMVIYQSVYGFKNTFGIEGAYSRTICNCFNAEVGFRLCKNPLLPEGFMRMTMSHKIGWWTPSIGIESGITNRAYFKGNSNLLKEAAESMIKDIGKGYISSHSELFSFVFNNQWIFKLMEIDIGTHYKHFGRTLRLQTSLLTIGKAI